MASAEALRILRELQSRPDNKVRDWRGEERGGAFVFKGWWEEEEGRERGLSHPPPLLLQVLLHARVRPADPNPSLDGPIPNPNRRSVLTAR